MSIYKANFKHSDCFCFPQLNVKALVVGKEAIEAVERRNYMTANQISFFRAKEERRHNKVSERHEHYDVRSRRKQAEAAVSQAATAEKQIGINWWAAQEAQRANLAREAETYRANVAKEQETFRHNYQGEQLDSYRYRTAAAAAQDQARAALMQASTAKEAVDVRRSELAETIRRNSAAISQAQAEQKEHTRHNLAQEAVSRSQVGELSRANKAAESLRGLELEEKTRHAKEQEKIDTSHALSDSRRAAAATTQASASVTQAGAASRRADNDTARVGLESIRTVTGGAKDVAATARDITLTIGGLFK